MPTENDGVIELHTHTNSTEELKMSAIDISPNVANQLLTETTGNIQATNAAARDNANTANGILRFAAVRNFDELGPTESRAVSGVIATPVASPTSQQGG